MGIVVITIIGSIINSMDTRPNILRSFFHPVHGGIDGRGWLFGRSIFESEITTLIETCSGIDYVRQLRLFKEHAFQNDIIQIGPDKLVFPSEIKINIINEF